MAWVGAAISAGSKLIDAVKPAASGGLSSDNSVIAAAPAPTPQTSVDTSSRSDLSAPDLQGEAQRILGQQQALPEMAQAPGMQSAPGEIPHPSSQMAPQAAPAAQFTAPEAPAHPPQAIAQMQKWMIDWSAFE